MNAFVGIGFGPIQSGLFVSEGYRSGNFDRLTVAEVDESVVRAVRDNGGQYTVNVATSTGITSHVVEGVRMLDPNHATDRAALVEAIAAADEIATALPSVAFYESIDYLAEGLRRRTPGSPVVIYASENHNHAAEILAEKMEADRLGARVQFLNTVIGKMSGVIVDVAEQQRLGLHPFTPAGERTVLVEEFNRILISRIALPGFRRGIEVFEEKDDLLPFEEAKLYGHNAIHALLGYLARERGCVSMANVLQHPDILQTGREAFLLESGAGLLHRYRGTDPLFTTEGFQAYADDLLARMTSPFLSDPLERVIRNPQRKLGWDDRLVGAMRLALEAGVTPVRLATGVKAAAALLSREELRDLWPAEAWQSGTAAQIAALAGLITDHWQLMTAPSSAASVQARRRTRHSP